MKFMVCVLLRMQQLQIVPIAEFKCGRQILLCNKVLADQSQPLMKKLYEIVITYWTLSKSKKNSRNVVISHDPVDSITSKHASC